MSVIVPVYNEESEIGVIVPAVRRMLEARGGDWEILVVDNASTDATVERVQALVEEPRVRLLRNPQNRGKGYSVRRGMLEARGELRLMCDADCTASLVSLPAMEAAAADADVVAGLRNARDSVVKRYQPLRRRAASICFIWLCRQVMSEPLPDVFCGFKLFTAAAAQDVFSLADIDGWAFDAEVLALARALGYRVLGSGITWVNRPASRLSMPRVVIPVLRELIAARRRVSEVATRAADGGLRTSEPVAPPVEDPARSA